MPEVITYERHYYKQTKEGKCLVECKVRKAMNVKIGSAACVGCDNCVAHSDNGTNKPWIMCRVIDEATA